MMLESGELSGRFRVFGADDSARSGSPAALPKQRL